MNANTKMIFVDDDRAAVMMIVDHLTKANSQAPVIEVTNPFPNLETIDVFDAPGSCRGITPQNRHERRAEEAQHKRKKT